MTRNEIETIMNNTRTQGQRTRAVSRIIAMCDAPLEIRQRTHAHVLTLCDSAAVDHMSQLFE